MSFMSWSRRALALAGAVTLTSAVAGCSGSFTTSMYGVQEVSCGPGAQYDDMSVEGCWTFSSYSGPLGIQSDLTQLLKRERAVTVAVEGTDCPAEVAHREAAVECSFRTRDSQGRTGLIEIEVYRDITADPTHFYNVIVLFEMA